MDAITIFGSSAFPVLSNSSELVASTCRKVSRDFPSEICSLYIEKRSDELLGCFFRAFLYC